MYEVSSKREIKRYVACFDEDVYDEYCHTPIKNDVNCNLFEQVEVIDDCIGDKRILITLVL